MSAEAIPGGAAPVPEEEEAPKAPLRQAPPKMSLHEQTLFLNDLLSRCVLHSPAMKGTWAGQALLALSTEDMLRLETVRNTLEVFDMQGAADLVRREIWRKRQNGSGRR